MLPYRIIITCFIAVSVVYRSGASTSSDTVKPKEK